MNEPSTVTEEQGTHLPPGPATALPILMFREPAGGLDTRTKLLIDVMVFILNPLSDQNYLADLT